jgi:4,5-DOPA dioxygenase extradiol
MKQTAFIGHGNPMNTLERNRFTDSWRSLGASVTRPAAVLCISAHWYTNATAVTAMANPRTIHDFYGFPDELFAVEYPAPGDPELAGAIVEIVKPRWVGLDYDSWGFDHGTWSVLKHMFPDADVPVIQLSINALEPLDYHLDLGQRLAPLLARNVFVVASGNIVHNLRRVAWDRPDEGFDWAHRFDDAAREVLANDPADVLRLADHPDYALAVPTPDHFIPMLYFAGLVAEQSSTTEPFVDGCALGSLSMTSYASGCGALDATGATDAAQSGLTDVPADQSNM